MVLTGSALIGPFTLAFTVSGDPGAWTITVTERDHLPLERETKDALPYRLLDEMLTDTVASCRRNFHRAALIHVANKTPIRRAR